MRLPVLLGVGTLALFVVFTAVWALAMRIKNASIVDVAWSYGFAVLAIVYGTLAGGDSTRRALIATMTILWSLRLGTYLGWRIARAHPVEDGRYAELRRSWGRNIEGKFLAFFLFQALLNVVLSTPLLLACLYQAPAIAPVEWAGVALWIVAITGEATADRQLAAFKADASNKGRVCDVGLWHFSRHPNYFFEWLVWCSYFLFALGSPWGFVTFYCPLLMLFFLFEVTGIPATEAQALRTKGDAYREYQRTTSAFVPWPPR